MNLAITTNTFFGVAVSEEAKMNKFDDSPYDVILFDEIYLNNLLFLRTIKEYSETHPENIILATGDPNQKKPVDVLSTEIEHKTYANHCISIIFPNQITLHVSKRITTEEGRNKFSRLQNDVLNEDIPLGKTIKNNSNSLKTHQKIIYHT